ncbi:hypothetical protein LguiA_018846 [Lonicera macranthoides]
MRLYEPTPCVNTVPTPSKMKKRLKTATLIKLMYMVVIKAAVHLPRAHKSMSFRVRVFAVYAADDEEIVAIEKNNKVAHERSRAPSFSTRRILMSLRVASSKSLKLLNCCGSTFDDL